MALFGEHRMPSEGLYRAGRWADVKQFPPPSQGAASRIVMPGPPLIDGYPRWEDAYGRFSTAKFSASALAAIGRTIAGYRCYVSEGINFFDKVKAFLADPDLEAEPVVLENSVPPAYFEDAHLVHLEHDPDLVFIDVEHPDTLSALETLLGATLNFIGASIEEGVSGNRDRRVTRLAMTTLYDLCIANEDQHIAGIRYAAPEPNWDAYVFWSPPRRVDLSRALTKPIFPDDGVVREAAERLGLRLP